MRLDTRTIPSAGGLGAAPGTDLPLTQQPSTSLVGVFNMGRHLLERAFPCPCVVFVPQETMTRVKTCPGFVSWQTGAFFVPFDAAEVEAMSRATLEIALAGSTTRPQPQRRG